MKILIIHCYYLQRGGEDVIFEQEAGLIGETEEVTTLTFRNKPGMRGLWQFLVSIWNRGAGRKIRKAIRETRPDAVHLHNWHFGIGPLAIRVAGREGIPVILTINNYRLLCPSATFLHRGHLFTQSLNAGFPWKAVIHKAYRHSILLTFWLAFIIWFHKKIGTWKKVDAYIVNTEFAKSVFARSSFGVSPDRFLVKPNFVTPSATPEESRGEHMLFVGRLSEEKGISTLIEAFRRIPYDLYIAGDGPLKDLVTHASRTTPNIKFLGRLDQADVLRAMSACDVLVFPSVWYEGMPMTIVESFATGTPVIASNLGAMGSMIKHGYNGLHFEKGDVTGLCKQLETWHNLEKAEKSVYHSNVRETYKRHYTAETNKHQLTHLYKNLLYAKTADQHQH